MWHILIGLGSKDRHTKRGSWLIPFNNAPSFLPYVTQAHEFIMLVLDMS